MADQTFNGSGLYLPGLGGGPVVGRATQLTTAAAPQRPLHLQGAPARPAPKPVKEGEIFNVPVHGAALFQGDAPSVGDAVELVCVRADDGGWGLALRVKKES